MVFYLHLHVYLPIKSIPKVDSRTMNNLKTFVLGGSYIVITSVKISYKLDVPDHGLGTNSLKSSNVGADMTFASRPFQSQKGSLVGVDGTIYWQKSLMIALVATILVIRSGLQGFQRAY